MAQSDQSDTESAPSPYGPGAVVATEAPKTAKGKTERVLLSRREQALSRRLAESKATVPHVYLDRTVVLPDRDALSPAFVVAATGRALATHRRLNGAYRDGALELHSRINVGLFVEAEGGALLPTVFDADTKHVTEIGTEIAELAGHARAGTLASPALSGGTFSVTLLEQGGDRVLAPVMTGQAGHLGVGRVRREIVPAADGAAVSADVATVTLSCDARAVRPPDAASFLEELAGLLANPDGARAPEDGEA